MKTSTMVCGIALFGLWGAAEASDWGCEVLLCMSNPAGPKAVSECVPPINKLYSELRKGRPFPTCNLMSAGTGSTTLPGSPTSWAEMKSDYYDFCPAGTTELAPGLSAALDSGGTLVAWGSKGLTSDPTGGASLFFSDGIAFMMGNPAVPISVGANGVQRTCVGNLLSSGTSSYGPVGWYDQVVVLEPQPSPDVIDIYIDNTWTQRIRLDTLSSASAK